MGRFSGEEFTFLLPETNIDSAVIVAERVRTAVENSSLIQDSHKLHITISIGATQLKKDDTIDVLLQRADKAMYQAKRNGRNQTSWL